MAAEPQLTAGDEVELMCEHIAHGGVSIARHEGRVVFVTGSLPGEHVRVRISQVKRSFARADAIGIVRAAPERVPHIWPEASIERDPALRPGGAELGHIQLPAQRELKAQVLHDALTRFAGVTAHAPVEPVPGDDERRGTRWRTRVRLHISAEGTVGPVAARSRRVIPVRSLPLAHASIEQLAPLDGQDPDRPGSRLRGPGRIELIVPRGPGAGMRITRRGAPAREPGTVTELVHDRPFQVDEDGFWQVHEGAAATLFDAVRKMIDPAQLDPAAQHLDLYGGVGLLAAAIGEAAGPAARIRTVEAFEPATRHARVNLAEWRGAEAITARVEDYLRETRHDAARGGVIVLDPPRAGAGREVVTALSRLAPAQIVYVACDPVALARDTGFLRELGWRLDALRAFDLFPNTHHLEAVARFMPDR